MYHRDVHLLRHHRNSKKQQLKSQLLPGENTVYSCVIISTFEGVNPQIAENKLPNKFRQNSRRAFAWKMVVLNSLFNTSERYEPYNTQCVLTSSSLTAQICLSYSFQMKCKRSSFFIIALLLACAFPAILGAQPNKTDSEFEPVDTCGNFILFGKKAGSPPRFSEFYVENTTTHTRLTLSMENIYRYDFQHGFLISYGVFETNVYHTDGSLLAKTGMRVIDFLPGDTLFSAYNFEYAWKIFSTSGELIASGQGTPWYGYTFTQTYDSLIVVPGPNQTVGLINTKGVWLAWPVFSKIEPAQNNTLRAAIGNRYGTLEPNGIFHEPDGTLTVASAVSVVQGMGDPNRTYDAIENLRILTTTPTILDIYHEFTVAMDPSMGFVLTNAATKETFKLPMQQILSCTIDFPFLRMKYFSAPIYKEALVDLKGNLLAEELTYINVVRNGDSTVIVGNSREWQLYDWKMNLVNSSALMKLPEGDGQNIKELSKGFYAVGVRYETSGGNGSLYEMVDRNGRVITDPIFNNCYYYNNEISAEVCNGQRAEIDTAGNVYYKGDPAPHRITRESLLKDRSYRKIRIKKSERSYNGLTIEINPYCYDRHTSEKKGNWQIESWYENGKLIAQHRKKDVTLKKSNSYRPKHRVTETATVYKHGIERKRVRYEYTPTWF
jgi:hypothetical protein